MTVTEEACRELQSAIQSRLKRLEHAIDVERASAEGFARELAIVLWGMDYMDLPAKEIFRKFRVEVYEKGIQGLLSGGKDGQEEKGRT